MERGLWGFIAGTETPPEETATVAVKNAYRLRSDKAYSFIIALSVDKSLQVHITTTTVLMLHGKNCRSNSLVARPEIDCENFRQLAQGDIQNFYT